MSALGDERAARFFTERLTHPDSRIAAEAARTLVEIGTSRILESLFWFVASPPLPSAHLAVPTVLAALEGGGPAVVDSLQPLLAHDHPKARRLMIELIVRCRHPQGAALLQSLGEDTDPDIQHAALDGLAELNTTEAADTLYALLDKAPRRWIVRALAAMSIPRAVELLRSLDADATTLRGTLLDDRKPLHRASVQVVQEHLFEAEARWGWRAISGRAETDSEGIFALTLFMMEPGQSIRLKVTTPFQADGSGGESFTADLALSGGRDHAVRANIDRFFERLIVE
jgi:hypothetical protein